MKKTLTLLMISLATMACFAQNTFEKIIDLGYETSPTEIVENADSSFFILASKYKYSGTTTSEIMHISKTGEILHIKEFDNFYYSKLSNLYLIDNHICALGIVKIVSSQDYKLGVIKLDKEFNIISTDLHTINDFDIERITTSFLDNENNIIIIGSSLNQNKNRELTGKKSYIMKISLEGELLAMHNTDVLNAEISYFISDVYNSDDNEHYMFLLNNLTDWSYSYLKTNKNDLAIIDTIPIEYTSTAPLDSVIYHNSVTNTNNTRTHIGYQNLQDLKNNQLLLATCNEDNLITQTKLLNNPQDTISKPAAYTKLTKHAEGLYTAYTINMEYYVSLHTHNSIIEVINFDNDLNELWRKRFDNSYYKFVFSIKTTNDNGCILLCSASDWENGDTQKNLYLLKLDADGNLLWQQELSTPSASIYPNPGRKYFEIEETENVNSVELYNMSGVMVLSQEIENNSNRIDTGELPSGLYIYKVKDDNGKVSYQGKWMRD